MGAVDFAEWVTPDLEITLPGADGTPGGRTYMVRPPSVEAMKMVLAAAVRAEVRLGLEEGPIPDEVQQVLDSIGDSHPALGDDVYERMRADGVPASWIDRVAYYATFFWAKGRAYADRLAVVLFAPPDVESTPEADASPKA
ncbi:hypothetical protein [Agromyces sp. NPDC058064]|uniref:DUF7426 family protein n=1 Tax=Agromyces sp. NPDC058064 TaxID=3346322 RepID=UPI0036DDBBE6